MNNKVKKIMNLTLLIVMITIMLMLFAACSSEKSEKLKDNTNVSESNDVNADVQYVSLSENIIKEKVTDEQSAKLAVESVASSLGITDVETELQVKVVEKIDNDSYYRMQQYYKGIPVYGRSVVLSADSDGNVHALTANSTQIDNVDIKSEATQEDVDVSVKQYFDNEDAIIEKISEDRLSIYSLDLDEEPRLIYNISVVTEEGAFDVLIDAKTAEIVESYDAVRYVQKEFECKGQEGTQKFFAESNENVNTMAYVSNTGTNIHVYEPKNTAKYTWFQEGNADLITWKDGKKADKSAVDAMANMQKTYTFFRDVLQRDSFDGETTDIDVYVHVTGYQDYEGENHKTRNNAYHWNSPNGHVFAFTVKYSGFLKDSEYSSDLDVVAHEYMHGVESTVSSMIYKGESGAIMEAYSDIFGELVEDYSKDGVLNGDCDWDVIGRNFIEPVSNDYPNTYRGEHWADTTNLDYDNGGVHINNTVLSHAMYLMWNGIDGDENKKINTSEIAELWYRALYFLQSNATFRQCANAVVVAAQQMEHNGKISEEQVACVKDAFIRVGIYTDMTEKRTVAKGSVIYVLDENLKKYDDYHIVIENAEGVVAEQDIADKNGYIIDCESGEYVVKVVDNAVNGSKNEFSLKIKVVDLGENSKVKNVVHLYTDYREKILATDFSIPSEQIVTLGELSVIEVELVPANAENYQVQWHSSDETVASISGSGKTCIITSRAKGKATITATLISGEKTITKTTNLRVASKGRDTVLVLDISGSMSGTPLNEMKKAAVDFCKQLLEDEYNNRVGIVFYDDQIKTISLTNDLDSLVSTIEQVSSGGSTNMEGGIAAANNMLVQQGKTDNIKNIVVMADGLPNQGKTSSSGSMNATITTSVYQNAYANAVVDTAQEAMKTCNMYSLGFFHDLSGNSLDFATELMKKLTNQADGYHQVEQAENLQFAFGDISEEISDGSKIIINIACPVDVSVTHNGETLCSADASYNDKTSFGTLQLLGANQDIKVVTLNPNTVYNIDLTGTDEGEMNYSVNYLNEKEEIIDSREFVAVPITANTKITSNTSVETENMDLNIDENGDGVIDSIWSAAENKLGSITFKKESEVVKEDEKVTKEPTKDPIEETKQKEKGFDTETWNIALILLGVLCFVVMIVVIVLVCIPKQNTWDKQVDIIEPEIGKAQCEVDVNVEKTTEDNELVFEPSISILSGPLAGAEIPIYDKEVIYIGKDPRKANIVFSGDYPNISRLHCSIMYDVKYRKYFVTDCSSNGTYYSNGCKLEKGKRTMVDPGTIIILANETAKIILR